MDETPKEPTPVMRVWDVEVEARFEVQRTYRFTVEAESENEAREVAQDRVTDEYEDADEEEDISCHNVEVVGCEGQPVEWLVICDFVVEADTFEDAKKKANEQLVKLGVFAYIKEVRQNL